MDRHPRDMRPHRASSPIYAPERKIRRRRNDAGTDELIRFVREFQMEKQPTLLRLQRRAPLPGIGEGTSVMRDSGYVERIHDVIDSDDDDDVMVDSEIAAIEDNAKIYRQGSFVKRKSETSFRSRRTSVNSRSFQNLPTQNFQTNAGLSKYGGDNVYGSYGGLGLMRQNTLMKQLPPIKRQELPERPSAPSPNITPPVPGEDLDSAGEPVDFIDPS